MKYWFFNGSDVVGPFTPKELLGDKSFNENSLICPEFFSDEQDHWQPALSFEEFQPLLASTQPPQDLTLEQEMDTLLQEKSPLSFEKTNTDNAGLQLPKKPAKPGPIEEYFDHIEKEDLGDILGIPQPAENSDMDLAHALEHQLAKTSSTRRKEQELTAADAQTAEQLTAPEELPQAQQTHHIATATEVFATKPPTSSVILEQTPPADTPSLSNDLPPLPIADFQGMPTTDTAPILGDTLLPVPKSPAQPQAEVAPAVPSAQDTPLPVSAPNTSAGLPAPAPSHPERVEVNSINARLKQTQEMKDFLQTQTNKATGTPWERNSILFLVAVLVITGTLFALRQLQAGPVQPVEQEIPPAVSNAVQELLPQTAPATPRTTSVTPRTTPAVPQTTSVAPQPAPAPKTDARGQALTVVQNHLLSEGRGTLAGYLNRIYQTQLSQGYVGTWEAQPLHKNTYLVKYRLTKTRKEPIIYIFQADVAQGKLTGALNNISLDLVGKIQS